MKTKLYLRGCLSPCGTTLHCPLSSSVVLFIIEYCQTKMFQPIFVHDDPNCDFDKPFVCSYELQNLRDMGIEFSSWTELPPLLHNVSLPSVYQPEMCLIRAGLCIVLRHIVAEAHTQQPHLELDQLLGFRKGSMKMCAEVSGWTKLCEVDLGKSITELVRLINKTDEQTTSLPLPLDLSNLESHFNKKCLVHNDDRKKRSELKRILKYFSSFPFDSSSDFFSLKQKEEMKIDKSEINEDIKDDSLVGMVLESVLFNKNQICIIYHIILTHGIKKVKIQRGLGQHLSSSNSQFEQITPTTVNEPTLLETQLNSIHITASKSITPDDSETPSTIFRTDTVPDVRVDSPDMTFEEVLRALNYMDVEFVHVYSEGLTLTIADLILLTYIQRMVQSLSFDTTCLGPHCPNILRWMTHLASLYPVARAAEALGLQLAPLPIECRKPGKQTNITFLKNEKCTKDEEEEFELSRNAKQKHRAIKPLVLATLDKVKTSGIHAVRGAHPCGDQVTVDWTSLPAGVHPREGDVPEKRFNRKCQQLENLVTAVEAAARPGDIIIDFCSGGGHLGIAIAYLLPQCRVYLVENKEQSLLKACGRLAALKMTNVILYQCNIDYYLGGFDMGVSLHACGSATDMVLQLCLRANAAFVICPCCYGGIKNTHLLTYPQSNKYIRAELSYKDFLTLGHAADQTEFNIALENQGRQCMDLVDCDRAELAAQHGYRVTLCSLSPLSCSPKNNLLVGTRVTSS